MKTTITWPDTTHDEPPADHLYRSATWLLGRHPKLAQLAERVPGVVSNDFPLDGPEIDLERLVLALVELDADRAAWAEYERRRPAPYDDAKYDAWEAAGPPRGEQSQRLGEMSRTEVSRLRLLATFASSSPRRVPFLVADLTGFDDEGQQLIADWCRALLAA
jgi:hypothetical protein